MLAYWSSIFKCDYFLANGRCMWEQMAEYHIENQKSHDITNTEHLWSPRIHLFNKDINCDVLMRNTIDVLCVNILL